MTKNTSLVIEYKYVCLYFCSYEYTEINKLHNFITDPNIYKMFKKAFASFKKTLMYEVREELRSMRDNLVLPGPSNANALSLNDIKQLLPTVIPVSTVEDFILLDSSLDEEKYKESLVIISHYFLTVCSKKVFDKVVFIN